MKNYEFHLFGCTIFLVNLKCAEFLQTWIIHLPPVAKKRELIKRFCIKMATVFSWMSNDYSDLCSHWHLANQCNIRVGGTMGAFAPSPPPSLLILAYICHQEQNLFNQKTFYILLNCPSRFLDLPKALNIFRNCTRNVWSCNANRISVHKTIITAVNLYKYLVVCRHECVIVGFELYKISLAGKILSDIYLPKCWDFLTSR